MTSNRFFIFKERYLQLSQADKAGDGAFYFRVDPKKVRIQW